MYSYNGIDCDVWLSTGKIELNAKTGQKDLKKLYDAKIEGVVLEPKATK